MIIAEDMAVAECTECRICGNSRLLSVLDLGNQALTGIFPRPGQVVPTAPLELVRCGPGGCGLVQLRHTADLSLMYGVHYGYRSSVRPFMVKHLHRKVEVLTGMVDLDSADLVLDIGSNDATLLRGYPANGLTRVGIDPTGEKWREYYRDDIDLIPEFFSKASFAARYGDRKAKVVTSIAMFYDLPDPLGFMAEVRDILTEDGVWMIEMSYAASLLEIPAYDAICHEHLEYYMLSQIEWMAERVGLTVSTAEITDVNGGSLCVTLVKDPTQHKIDTAEIDRIRRLEANLELDTMAPYENFARRVRDHRDSLRAFLEDSRAAGKSTLGYGASTKGNVILQYCGIGVEDLPCIGEVSAEKHGCSTPGTGISIVSEEEAKARRPDQLLVLPWVHRGGFIEREQEFLARGGKLVFPLPSISTV
ncbi:NDP-4-keto-2,6-dideoxyhexose 3-C-methyltransferase [Amycolatopsis marina]|uniref:NDP-4-keto-2,6-dideoxyhexose 3-C-methyltransferase n=1 Tax=Amycolatopsis marina TaxID=490629 RepID=A0A1I0ZJZ5_9PSEU|nr:class I SAM-dependent methyltransferase [Amycolatopsis marina]SFB25974.1 NDP-4-keto-2,6-dideoxyhexose 3-C-methyltransferase [Amycolatopsis marina]